MRQVCTLLHSIFTQSQRDAACCLSCCCLRSYRCCTWQQRQTAVWLPPHLATTTDNHGNLLTRAHLHTHTQRHECALQRTYALICSFWWEDNCGTRHSHCQNRHNNRQTDRWRGIQTDRQPQPPPVEKHLWRYEPHFPRAPQTHINKIFSCNKTQMRLVCGEGLRMYSVAIQCVSFCQLREWWLITHIYLFFWGGGLSGSSPLQFHASGRPGSRTRCR